MRRPRGERNVVHDGVIGQFLVEIIVFVFEFFDGFAGRRDRLAAFGLE